VAVVDGAGPDPDVGSQAVSISQVFSMGNYLGVDAELAALWASIWAPLSASRTISILNCAW
jgi:hypothetical protein